MSDSLWPHGLQHARPPCPSPTPRAYSNSCPSRRGCHPTILCSVIPFSSCLQSFPTSGSFPMSRFFTSGGQSIGVSASVLPTNIQDWFPLGWTGLISLSPRDSQESSSTPQFKRISSLVLSLLYHQTHIHWVDDAIQPSHPLLPPSTSVLNLSQPRLGMSWLLTSGSQSTGGSVLPRNIQGWFSSSHVWMWELDYKESWVQKN